MTPEEKAAEIINKLPMIGWNVGRPEALPLIAEAIRAASNDRIVELEAFIQRLLDCGGWYRSAIEIDLNAAGAIDGEALEAEARALLTKEKPAAPDDATG